MDTTTAEKIIINTVLRRKDVTDQTNIYRTCIICNQDLHLSKFYPSGFYYTHVCKTCTNSRQIYIYNPFGCKMSRFTQKEELVKDFNDGMQITKIAKKYNISPKSVYNWLDKIPGNWRYDAAQAMKNTE